MNGYYASMDPMRLMNMATDPFAARGIDAIDVPDADPTVENQDVAKKVHDIIKAPVTEETVIQIARQKIADYETQTDRTDFGKNEEGQPNHTDREQR